MIPNNTRKFNNHLNHRSLIKLTIIIKEYNKRAKIKLAWKIKLQIGVNTDIYLKTEYTERREI